jgi:hypothetical protein
MNITTNKPEEAVGQICNALIVAVRDAMGKDFVLANIDAASRIMKAEIHAFIWGDEYANERDCYVRGTISMDWIMQTLTASCVIKLKEATRSGTTRLPRLNRGILGQQITEVRALL